MLAAMMSGGPTYTTRVNLLAVGGTWTVPAGVTRVVIFGAATGNISASATATAAGGGGAILNVPLTVAPGDVWTITSSSVGGGIATQYDFTSTGTGSPTLQMVTGWSTGQGGSASVSIGAIFAVAGGGVSAGANGGSSTAAGGIVLGGGAGGAFNGLGGGDGGSSGQFAGVVHTGAFGGGGGGFFPGASYITNSTYVPSSLPSSFLYFQY